MMSSLLPVLPLLLLFLLGFGLQRIRFFSTESLSHVRRIVSDLALPAVVFQAFASIELESRYLFLVGVVFAICAVMVVLGKLVAKLLKIDSPYFALMMGGFEVGMLGYALFVSFHGQAHLGKMALMDLGEVVFVFTVLMALLIKQRDGSAQLSTLLRRITSSPVIWAIAAGLVASFIGPHVPRNAVLDQLGRFVELLASLTVPLIALTIGYGIRFSRASLGIAIKTIAVRKILLIGWALVIDQVLIRSLLGMDAMYSAALLTMFMLPPPFVISIYMSDKTSGQSDYVANTLSLDTLVSVVSVMVVYLIQG